MQTLQCFKCIHQVCVFDHFLNEGTNLLKRLQRMLRVRLTLSVVIVEQLVYFLVCPHPHLPFGWEDALLQRVSLLPFWLIGALSRRGVRFDQVKLLGVDGTIGLLRQLSIWFIHLLVGLVAYHRLDLLDGNVVKVTHNFLVLVQNHVLVRYGHWLCLIYSQLVICGILCLRVICLVFVLVLHNLQSGGLKTWSTSPSLATLGTLLRISVGLSMNGLLKQFDFAEIISDFLYLISGLRLDSQTVRLHKVKLWNFIQSVAWARVIHLVKLVSLSCGNVSIGRRRVSVFVRCRWHLVKLWRWVKLHQDARKIGVVLSVLLERQSWLGRLLAVGVLLLGTQVSTGIVISVSMKVQRAAWRIFGGDLRHKHVFV